ncbi:shikimate kinase [Geobacillus sp. CAMR12739]|nr:shikimate kinase [Geobacillus sp. CAMR12739]
MERQTIIPLRERNIILIGFMGAGKTTIGQLVAKKLYRDFIDVDAEIERRHGMPIPEIFAQKGEAYFRQVERELIVDLCMNTRLKIISLGGGAYLQEDVRRACLAHGIVFFLDLSWEHWKEERLPLIVDSRPVLKIKRWKKWSGSFLQRQSAYALHHSRVVVNELEAEQAAKQIVDSIKWTWDVYEPNR